jgi:hypothetical protein
MPEPPLNETSIVRQIELGWKKTVTLIVLLVVAMSLASIATYLPIGHQLLRIGVWIAFLLAFAFSVGAYVDCLRAYDLQFLSMPSTWLMLLNLALVWVLSVSFGDSISLVNGIPWVHRTNDFGAILIAAIVLLFVSSVVSNIARTNLVFGVILTITQVLFSILLVILFYLIAACLGDRKRPD